MSSNSAVEARIADLGYELPGIAKPVASYVPAVTSGNLVFTSGQLPFIDGELPERSAPRFLPRLPTTSPAPAHSTRLPP
jgi:hypothetical protein